MIERLPYPKILQKVWRTYIFIKDSDVYASNLMLFLMFVLNKFTAIDFHNLTGELFFVLFLKLFLEEKITSLFCFSIYFILSQLQRQQISNFSTPYFNQYIFYKRLCGCIRNRYATRTCICAYEKQLSSEKMLRKLIDISPL